MCVNPHWNTEGAGQPKIRNLDTSIFVYQQILGFQVPARIGHLERMHWDDDTCEELVADDRTAAPVAAGMCRTSSTWRPFVRPIKKP